MRREQGMHELPLATVSRRSKGPGTAFNYAFYLQFRFFWGTFSLTSMLLIMTHNSWPIVWLNWLKWLNWLSIPIFSYLLVLCILLVLSFIAPKNLHGISMYTWASSYCIKSLTSWLIKITMGARPGSYSACNCKYVTMSHTRTPCEWYSNGVRGSLHSY